MIFEPASAVGSACKLRRGGAGLTTAPETPRSLATLSY
jgi:hypothetical protein